MNQDTFHYYEILKVSPSATSHEIRESYKALSLKLHPDKNSSPNAKEQFQELAAAYAVLRDPKRRSLYDNSALFPPKDSMDDLEHFSDMYTYMFNMFGSGRAFDPDDDDFWDAYHSENRKYYSSKKNYKKHGFNIPVKHKQELLRTQTVPDQLKKPKIIPSLHNTIVSWKNSGTARKQILKYIVEVTKGNEKQEHEVNGETQEIELVSLLPGSYSVKVCASNSMGRGIWSFATNFIVKASEVPQKTQTTEHKENNTKREPRPKKQLTDTEKLEKQLREAMNRKKLEVMKECVAQAQSGEDINMDKDLLTSAIQMIEKITEKRKQIQEQELAFKLAQEQEEIKKKAKKAVIENAQEQLRIAMDKNEEQELADAIQNAIDKSLELHDPELLKEAKDMLKDIKCKAVLQQKMEKAIANKDSYQLLELIEKAKLLGIDIQQVKKIHKKMKNIEDAIIHCKQALLSRNGFNISNSISIGMRYSGEDDDLTHILDICVCELKTLKNSSVSRFQYEAISIPKVKHNPQQKEKIETESETKLNLKFKKPSQLKKHQAITEQKQKPKSQTTSESPEVNEQLLSCYKTFINRILEPDFLNGRIIHGFISNVTQNTCIAEALKTEIGQCYQKLASLQEKTPQMYPSGYGAESVPEEENYGDGVTGHYDRNWDNVVNTEEYYQENNQEYNHENHGNEEVYSQGDVGNNEHNHKDFGNEGHSGQENNQYCCESDYY